MGARDRSHYSLRAQTQVDDSSVEARIASHIDARSWGKVQLHRHSGKRIDYKELAVELENIQAIINIVEHTSLFSVSTNPEKSLGTSS